MPRSAPRVARCALGLTVACALAVAGPAAAADAVTLKKASATASVRVTVSAVRSATTTMSATAVATVPGVAAPIRVTKSASATRTVRAAASSAGRKTATARATTRALARARARTLAVKSARAQARSKATALAAATAAAKARAAAAAAARAAAQRDAQATARQRAAVAASSGSTPANAPCGGEVVTGADRSPMTCSFDDEFDGASLDTTKWSAVTTASIGFRNHPDECFVDSPDTVSVSSGTLRLTTRPAPAYPCSDHETNFISGSVSSTGKFSQAYGTYSIRAKFPATTVAGLHSALWMWPDDQSKYVSWPASGEIDIAERFTKYADRAIPYLHYVYDEDSVRAAYTGSWTDGFSATGTNVATNNWCMLPDPNAFHTYTMTWRPGRIAISFDGKNCLTNDYAAKDLPAGAPFDQPFFMILTQALGADGTANAPTAATPSTATTEVDYVRVWK